MIVKLELYPPNMYEYSTNWKKMPNNNLSESWTLTLPPVTPPGPLFQINFHGSDLVKTFHRGRHQEFHRNVQPSALCPRRERLTLGAVRHSPQRLGMVNYSSEERYTLLASCGTEPEPSISSSALSVSVPSFPLSLSLALPFNKPFPFPVGSRSISSCLAPHTFYIAPLQ